MNKKQPLPSLLFLCLILIQPSASASWLSDQLIRYIEQRETKEEIVDTAPTPLSAEAAYARSIQLLSDGCQSEAEELITSAVKTHPHNPDLLFAHAVLKRSRWYMNEAAVWFKMLRKSDAPAYLKKTALLDLQLDRNRHTVDNMQALITLSDEHPDDVYLLWLSALQCRNRNMGVIAQTQYEKLLANFKLGPVLLHQTYANILTETLHQYDKALVHRQLAVSMEPKEWTLQGLANTLYDMGEYERSNATLAHLNRMDPRDTRYLNRRGDCLMKLDRPAEAAERYRRQIKLAPTQSAWDDLSRALFELKQYEEGVAAAESALKIDPEYGWAWGRKGRNCEKLERYKEAKNCYLKALEFNQFWIADDLSGLYLQGLGVEKDRAKAIEYMTLYTRKNPDSSWGFKQLGGYLAYGDAATRDPEKAIICFKKAIEIDPDSEHSLNALAWFYATSKDEAFRNYPEAVRLAERSVKIQKHHYNLDTLVVAYERNGQPEDALKTQKEMMIRWKKNHPKKETPSGQQKRLDRLQNVRNEK